jgi:uncharacterized metal-binding protein YceD (DUF177 family)
MATPPPVLEALRVDLAALRRRGLTTQSVQAVLPQAWMAEVLRDTDAEIANDGEVHLEVSLQPEGVVLVRGSLGLRLSVPCGRCLSAADVDGSTSIFATFMASAAAAHELLRHDEEGLEPDPDTPDVWSYDGPILGLEAMVAEQVALAYPMRALCARGEACRGLCSNCGFELNTLPGTTLQCPQCGHEVPLTPVADLPAGPEGDAIGSEQRELRESPLAAALRKLELD